MRLTAQFAQSTIPYTGIPQGSPLSPILYVLYNASLVEQANDQYGGAIGFIDDYTTWVVGPTLELNTQKIQRTVIPKAEAWARESGATFEAEKTGFVHFSRQLQKLLRSPPLMFSGAEINNTDRVKILGVTLDGKLRMDAHVERVTTAATAKCLALARLKGLRPKQMRQLYRSVVIPTTDYAASSWFSQARRGILRLVSRIERVQKMGAKIILRAFNGVTLRILEAEASLEPVKERLTRKVAAHLASLTSLQESNLVRQLQPERRSSTDLTPDLDYPTMERSSGPMPDGGTGPSAGVPRARARYGTAILYTDASARNGLNMGFSHIMREDGQKRKTAGQELEAPVHRSVALPANFSSESLSDGASGVNVIESSDETQLRVSREEMVEWVEETYRRNRGKELPGNTNHVLLSELFHVQSSRWSELAEAHINNIHQVVDEFMQAALEHVVREEGVRWEISQLILESLDRNARAGRSELDRLLEDEKQQPITYNHYYTDNIQKSRQGFLRNSMEKAMREATDHEWNGMLHISNNSVDGQKLLAALQRRINVDMDLQACEEALAGLNAYYKVVERHLIRNLPKAFPPESIIMLSDGDLRRIAAEPFGNAEKRQELRLLLENLKHSLNDLRN
ncbi:unnamed protein product [Aureobasidium pullulans]|nr:unnamed protein product [Aureobasidium pullulans]